MARNISSLYCSDDEDETNEETEIAEEENSDGEAWDVFDEGLPDDPTQ